MSNTRNFTHTSNFLFTTNLFSEESTTYAIQSCNLPGISFSHIQTAKSSVYGYLEGDIISYNSLNISLIIDENLSVWKEIFTNLQKMRNPENSEGSDEVKYSYLEIFNDGTDVIMKLEFKDCRISSIGDLQFNTTSEDEILTCDVEIMYDYYTIV